MERHRTEAPAPSSPFSARTKLPEWLLSPQKPAYEVPSMAMVDLEELWLRDVEAILQVEGVVPQQAETCLSYASCMLFLLFKGSKKVRQATWRERRRRTEACTPSRGLGRGSKQLRKRCQRHHLLLSRHCAA